MGVVAVGASEEHAGVARPWERGELVDGGDEEGGKAAVDGLVYGNDRERPAAAEVALEVHARELEVARAIAIWNEVEGVWLEFGSAPGAVL